MKNIPFTTEQFFEVIRNYNTTLFPVQLLLLAFGIIGFGLIHTRKPQKNKILGVLLGGIWIWTGVVYHLIFFTAINKAAYAFGGLFILQGILFMLASFRNRLEFEVPKTALPYTGYFFVIFGLFIYPVLSYILDNSLQQTIVFGLPCPTTITTFGFLMLTNRKLNKYLVIIPALWAIIGTSAAINFGVYPDYVMLLAALVATIYILRRKRIEHA